MMGMNGQTPAEMMTESEKKYMESLTPEQLDLMQKMAKERMELLKKSGGDGLTSDSTFDQNMTALGYAELEKPSYINIYPKDFESKEKIVDIIEDYNKKAKADGREEDTIEYTDYVGLTSVPVMPMPTPISADLMEGASLTPSPVIAVTSPRAFQALTIRTLCSGCTRAYTE